MREKKSGKTYFVNDSIINDIRDAIIGLDYGIVVIKVHGAKIVQLEVTKRKRFDDIWKNEEGGVEYSFVRCCWPSGHSA